MTTSMLDVRFVQARHSELLRQAEQQRLVRAAQAERQVERQADARRSGVWWRPSTRFGRRQLPQVIRPVAAL